MLPAAHPVADSTLARVASSPAGPFQIYESTGLSYWKVGRVFAMPPPSEHNMTMGDAFEMESRARWLVPMTASGWVHRAQRVSQSGGRLAGARSVHRVGLGWVMGSGPREGLFLAWPLTATGQAQPAPVDPVARWGAPTAGVSGLHVSEEFSDSQRGVFQCNTSMVTVPSGGLPAALVLKVSYHPRWECDVDGTNVPTGSCIPGFLFIDFPRKETARVTCRYQGVRWKAPLLLLSAGSIAVAVCALVMLCAASRLPRSPSPRSSQAKGNKDQ